MSFWQEHIRIGSYTFPRFIGGPLDGITDAPFRRVVRTFSAHELLYTEMRHVACVAHDSGKARTLDFNQTERPLSYQVAANKVEYILPALEKIIASGVDIIDLNIGCPARNVISSGSGSALMADLPRLKEILTTFRRHLNIPFTVKMRSGFKCYNAIDVARLAQDCGVDAIALHPRLQTQKFEGRPDYEYAARVRQAVTIPVIISGGVINWSTAKMVYEATGADGFLIGRGIWSKPWKLYELNQHAQGRPFAVSLIDIGRCAVMHFDAMLDYYGVSGMYQFRKHLPLYLRGIHGASNIRNTLVHSTDPATIRATLQQVFGVE